MQMIDKAVSKK